MSLKAPLVALLASASVSMATTAERPRLYLRAGDLPALRALGSQTSANVYGFSPGKGWQAVLGRARELAAAAPYRYQVQIPEANNKHAGWAWSYTLSATPPPPHPESPHYPPWTAMFQERGDSITTRLKHFSLAWLLTGEPLFLNKAKEIALALTKWPAWTDQSYSNGSLTACLDTGHATQTVALFYDWCHDQLTEAERAEVREALASKGIEPIRAQLAKLDPYHNFWAVVNTGLGIAALAIDGEDPRSQGWIAEAIANTVRQFDAQGADGGSYEGPMYGTYAADMLAQLIYALDTSETQHALRQHPFLVTLPRFAVNGLSPDVKGQPTFGDGGWGAAYPTTMAVLAAAGDEAARYYLVAAGLLSGVDEIDRLLFLRPLLSAAKLPQAPAWRGSDAFVDIGYAFLRGGDDEPFLAFKAGPPEKAIGHNHFDHNSFQLTGFGQVMAADPGYRSYFDPPRRRYTVGTLGHNSVVLDLDDAYLASQQPTTLGHDQVALAGARITELAPGPGISLVAGEAAATYNSKDKTVLDRFTRQVVYLPPHAFVVLDHLAAPAPHTFSWLLHAPAGAAFEGNAPLRLRQAGGELPVYLAASTPLTWRLGDYPGAEQYGPYAAASTTAVREAQFAAVMVPRRRGGLLANGDFELGLSGWTIRDADGQAPNHSASAEQVHGGQRSGRIDQAGYLYSSRFSLPVGAAFNARAWYRTEGATRGAAWQVFFWDAGNKAFANKRIDGLKSPAGWSEAVLEAVVPPGTATISVAFNYFDTGVGYVDDVAIDAPGVPAMTSGTGPVEVTPAPDLLSGFTIAVDGWRHVVSRGRAAGLETDGELAAVSLDPAGVPVRALLYRGTRLRYQGKDLVTVKQPATVTLLRDAAGWSAVVQQDLSPGVPPVDPASVGCLVAR